MTTNEFMKYLEYELWNHKVSKAERDAIMTDLYSLIDMHSPEEVAQFLIEDQKKYGDA